jgi:hypothetical protein
MAVGKSGALTIDFVPSVIRQGHCRWQCRVTQARQSRQVFFQHRWCDDSTESRLA